MSLSIVPLYQDQTNSSRQVRALELDGTVYALAAGPGGVFVYDMSAAGGLPSPCLDDAGSVCPGVYRGEVGTMSSGHYLDTALRDGKIYLAASDNDTGGLGLEIWELDDPTNPGSAVLKLAGLDADSQGTALFELNGSYYLAVVERVTDREIKIFEASDCLDADGCGSLNPPLATIAARQSLGPHYLTFSTRDGSPFLYYGISSGLLDGTKAELLLDLENLGASNEISEITDGGGTYLDGATGNTVDYWGDYYTGNSQGLRNFQPLVGRFKGSFFYRAAFGILDVHVEGGGIFSDGFESGDTAAWSSQVP